MIALFDALKGIGGQFEISRLVGAFGGVSYVIGANIFVAWDMIVKGREFDIVAYCAAFPGGLAIVVGATAGAVALKDRGVATAQVIRDTGALPTSGAPSAPQPVVVTNAASNPVQTEQV